MATNIVVPQLGESVVEARVARWLKKEGDPVAAGEPVVELETEKIDLEVGAEQAGVLARIARQEGEDVKVGELLGVVEPGAAAEAPAPAPASATAAPQARAAAAAPAEAAPAAAPARGESGRGRATPTARRMAETHDISLDGVAGTGEAGRITKRDVEGQLGAPAAAPAPAPAAPAPSPAPAPAPAAKAPAPAPAPRRRPTGERTEERVRMSKRRLTIARNLVEAQRTAAMLTTFNEVDMTAVMALRERRKQAFKERYGVNLGIASFFVKASIGALRAFPRLNAEIQGEEMVLKHYYDIGIAVGAPQGLVVPVLRDADQMSFAEIEQGIREFAAKASNGTLTLEDLKGGTFTITNGGVFGSLLSTPILNPPQVGILGLHKIEERPVAVNGQVVIRPMMYVALSYDHRIVDGLEAVQFLVRVKELVEDPGQMLLEG
ncbi:MAG TPA: 2-oxoglutarate dehydrogenase complex dihydrolipoyllysine-residue succinyltransferase [Vicinamibacterales bacterium]